VFSEQDVTSINSHNVPLHLVYKGMSDKSYILGIEKWLYFFYNTVAGFFLSHTHTPMWYREQANIHNW